MTHAILGAHVSDSQEATERMGRRLAGLLRPGWAVLLHGELGAGKTTFARGVADGLGVQPDEVSSPTFTLVQRYDGRLPLYHVDLYRLDRPADVDDLDLDDLLDTGAVVLVEWADRLPRRPRTGVDVWFEDLGDDRRGIRIARIQDPVHSTR